MKKKDKNTSKIKYFKRVSALDFFALSETEEAKIILLMEFIKVIKESMKLISFSSIKMYRKQIQFLKIFKIFFVYYS